ncbi:hypothetical protein JHK85_051022 [Glycine max]|nr:hypothetical protein JHK85_051022 [Glycine max]
MDLDHEDVMIIVPPIFAPKDVPENLVTFTSLMTIYGAIIEVLEEVGKDTSFEKYDETRLLLDVLQSFDFIFTLYLMVEILVFTNDLSVALQKRDQDLLNALSLVKATKEELQEMRNDGWEELISKVMEICNKHDIDVHDLNALYVQGKKPRRHATTSSLKTSYHVKFEKEIRGSCTTPILRLLSKISYYFSSGPFLRIWIKTGYDPLKDPNSRIGEDEEDGLMKEVNMTRKLVIWNDGGNDIVLEEQMRSSVPHLATTLRPTTATNSLWRRHHYDHHNKDTEGSQCTTTTTMVTTLKEDIGGKNKAQRHNKNHNPSI